MRRLVRKFFEMYHTNYDFLKRSNFGLALMLLKHYTYGGSVQQLSPPPLKFMESTFFFEKHNCNAIEHWNEIKETCYLPYWSVFDYRWRAKFEALTLRVNDEGVLLFRGKRCNVSFMTCGRGLKEKRNNSASNKEGNMARNEESGRGQFKASDTFRKRIEMCEVRDLTKSAVM